MYSLPREGQRSCRQWPNYIIIWLPAMHWGDGVRQRDGYFKSAWRPDGHPPAGKFTPSVIVIACLHILGGRQRCLSHSVPLPPHSHAAQTVGQASPLVFLVTEECHSVRRHSCRSQMLDAPSGAASTKPMAIWNYYAPSSALVHYTTIRHIAFGARVKHDFNPKGVTILL